MLVKKVLIGIDDSKYAEHAAQYGFDVARQFNADVALVNIIEPLMVPQSSSGVDPIMGMPMQGTGAEEMELLDIQKNHSDSVIDRIIEKLSGGLQVTHFSEFGSSADGIVKCAREFGADLIVVGTHNRSGIDRLLMGSVAEHVVRHSEIPVLVVPFKVEG